MNQEINLAIVSHSYPTKQAPAQASFIKNEAHLLSDELQVDVYIPSVYALPFQPQYVRSLHPDEDELTVHKFSYLSFPRKKLASITRKSLSGRLLASLEKQRADVVHLHWLYPAGLAIPALQHAGYKTVLTIHGGDWNSKSKKLMPMFHQSMLASHKIICVGKKLSEEICSYDPALEKKVVHISHGIESDQFYPASDRKKEADQLGWETTKINILCIANLYNEKGVDLLIDAFAMQKNRQELHLHIVSPSSDEPTKEDVNNRIATHSLSDSVTFYGGMNQEKLSTFFRASDLLVSPSRKEGFGLVVAEAISSGTPVLATRSGGPEEIVNSDCGMLVDAGSSEKLAHGMATILDTLDHFDPAVMHRFIRTNFSITAKREKLMAVYREILE
ncbi:MAG: glycosyltransferase family 4 protein [Balneolaceae bacterium]